MTVRIAFWSGPRNVSTALMRAWASRPDTVAVDEPFYAYFLAGTGIDHPGRDETLARYPTDPAVVIESLLAPLPEGKTVLYQKQMSHHALPGLDLRWMDEMRHGFLIRDPAEMIVSYAKVRPDLTPDDLGMRQLTAIFERVEAEEPPIIDARDLLQDPAGVLGRVCEAFGIEFDERMLSWEAGPHPADGTWGRYWYANVERTTGFLPHRPRGVAVPGRYRELHAECDRHYRRMHERRIRV